jgi:hypothetical protein
VLAACGRRIDHRLVRRDRVAVLGAEGRPSRDAVRRVLVLIGIDDEEPALAHVNRRERGGPLLPPRLDDVLIVGGFRAKSDEWLFPLQNFALAIAHRRIDAADLGAGEDENPGLREAQRNREVRFTRRLCRLSRVRAERLGGHVPEQVVPVHMRAVRRAIRLRRRLWLFGRDCVMYFTVYVSRNFRLAGGRAWPPVSACGLRFHRFFS